MPMFEYQCEKCGAEFEELVYDPDETPPCPKCGAENAKKLMSNCFAGGGQVNVDIPNFEEKLGKKYGADGPSWGKPSGGCGSGG